MGGGGIVGISDGVGYTMVAVGVKVEGRGVAVGRVVWVRATPVCTMAMAVFCISVVGCAGAQAVSITKRDTTNNAFFISFPFIF